MKRKDYIKFADMIVENQNSINHFDPYNENAEYYQIGLQDMLNTIKSELIILFQSDNSSFDANRFNDYIDNKVKSLSIQ